MGGEAAGGGSDNTRKRKVGPRGSSTLTGGTGTGGDTLGATQPGVSRNPFDTGRGTGISRNPFDTGRAPESKRSASFSIGPIGAVASAVTAIATAGLSVPASLAIGAGASLLGKSADEFAGNDPLVSFDLPKSSPVSGAPGPRGSDQTPSGAPVSPTPTTTTTAQAATTVRPLDELARRRRAQARASVSSTQGGSGFLSTKFLLGA